MYSSPQLFPWLFKKVNCFKSKHCWLKSTSKMAKANLTRLCLQALMKWLIITKFSFNEHFKKIRNQNDSNVSLVDFTDIRTMSDITQVKTERQSNIKTVESCGSSWFMSSANFGFRNVQQLFLNKFSSLGWLSRFHYMSSYTHKTGISILGNVFDIWINGF